MGEIADSSAYDDVKRTANGRLFLDERPMAQREPFPSIEDVRKCGEEIKQLKNQQFLLGVGALTLFGAYAGMLLPRATQPPNISSLVAIYSSVFLLLIFGALYWWSHSMRILIWIIGVWLEEATDSAWETDYRTYQRTYRHTSHSKGVSNVFLLLGLAVPSYCVALALHLSNAASWGHWLVFGVVVGAYLTFVFGFGYLWWGVKQSDIRNRWRPIIEQPHGAKRSL